jgi:Predicted ferric reductase
MRNIKRALWGILVVLSVLWFLAEPTVYQADNFFALRGSMVQLSGVLAIGAMSVAMVLALRPRWPERWLGGLDKMYRLHKWLGIAALVFAVLHWLWAKGPKWLGGLGFFTRPARGERPPIENPVEQVFLSLRGTAEGLGEWTFYAIVVLIALALIKYFPYRYFYKTHRLIAVAYLVMAFHAVVLVKFAYWTTPVGIVTALLLAAGTYAAVIVLLRRVGAARQVEGEIVTLNYYPGVHALETEVAVSKEWPGHRPGQFAFAMSDRSEGAHPYTIASGWGDSDRRITFVTKELGDHTGRLREKLRVGQRVKIEGPYGCFDFDDGCPRQIWIGGGIGITPFIAAMQHVAAERRMRRGSYRPPEVDLFHATSEYDETAIAKLQADAEAAGIRMHLFVDDRDGRLTGDRIRAIVPDWQNASIWFCGPTGFGEAIRRDFAAQGLPVDERFHQELFEMR